MTITKRIVIIAMLLFLLLFNFIPTDSKEDAAIHTKINQESLEDIAYRFGTDKSKDDHKYTE